MYLIGIARKDTSSKISRQFASKPDTILTLLGKVLEITASFKLLQL
jgi:hypothetical protein